MRTFADIALARRLESLVAEEMRRFVATARVIDIASCAEALEIAGGVAAFVGPSSPVNQAAGIGLDGPVAPGEIAAIEEFYAERGARAVAAIAPHAHPTLISAFAERGWTADGFENVLVRPIAEDERAHAGAHQAPPDPRLRIVEVADDEAKAVWAYVAAVGFSAPLDPLPEQLALARVVVARPTARHFLAFIGDDPAGTGELLVEDGVAWLSGDSTLPAWRSHGIQGALQRHRLTLAEEAGCDLAAAEARPGSPSQRNQERRGFRVAYTRTEFIAPEPHVVWGTPSGGAA